MTSRRFLLSLVLLSACESLAAPAGDASLHNGGPRELEPLPADLIAACPESEQLQRATNKACTEVGCVDGYNLDVSPSSGWAAGAYRFELDVDGRAVSCEGAIPLKSCNERSFSCDADGFRLGESGCALPATQHGIANISFEGYPLAINVRILKDGNELTATTLTPQYKAGQPNGPGCDPICCSASGTIAVPTSL